jgi:hypothetical protein
MGQHGGALELMVLIAFTSSILVLIGVYLSAHGHLRNGFAAALWTALCGTPILLGAARYLGMA